MNRPSYKELWLYERKDRDEQLQWIRDAVDGNAKFRNSEPPYSEEEELARQVMTMHSRIAELETEEIHVEWMSEDKLPEGISDEVFSVMYACSKVDFVRFYPFVTIDGDKCFLIKLPEVK